MIIVYCEKGVGWSPISYMVKLAAKLLEADLIILEHEPLTLINKVINSILKRQRNKEGEKLLLICPSPADLSLVFQIENYRKRFDYIAAWVIDSFWVDRIPKTVKLSGVFDHIFITSKEDIGEWVREVGTPTTWLPWASDVLGLGGMGVKQDWDLGRVGRQPREWDDDKEIKKLCDKRHITFSGRPSFINDASANQKFMMEVYQQTKFILAFSNLSNPTNYTHPSRAYLTARWVDALACGCVVAGISPQEESVEELLWKGATLEFETINVHEGLDQVSKALAQWTPEIASYNYKKSLKILDWRWRFMEIARVLEVRPKRLLLEIEQLNFKIG